MNDQFYYGLEEYMGIKMSENGLDKLIDIMVESLKISKLRFELTKPNLRISKLSKQDFSQKRYHSYGMVAFQEAVDSSKLAFQIAIIIFEWKEKLKKIKVAEK